MVLLVVQVSHTFVQNHQYKFRVPVIVIVTADRNPFIENPLNLKLSLHPKVRPNINSRFNLRFNPKLGLSIDVLDWLVLRF
jgi:hypothetical protein